MPNEQNKKFREEVVKDIPEGGRLLIVYFACEDEKYPQLREQDEPAFQKAAGNKQINIIIASKNNFIEELKSSNAVYMRGGETDRLMNELKKYPDFKNLIKGKTVAGSSAGAYILSKYYHSASKQGIYQGLEIVPVRIICHYKSEKFDYDRGDPLTMMKDYHEELPLVVLRDFEFKIFNQ